jgi:hypothetical protein
MDEVEVGVRGTALRWESDDFPGWIRVSVRDIQGMGHLIVEKASVLTKETITAASPFAMELWLDATTDAMSADTVHGTLSHGVMTVEGEGVLTVSADDVMWP